MEQHIENTTEEVPAPNMTFAELEQSLKSLDNAGKVASLAHNDKFNHLKDGEKVDGLERHLPGSMPSQCKLCDEVIFSFDKFMKMENQYFGVSGVPLSEIITQMRLIRSIMKMVDEEKNGSPN